MVNGVAQVNVDGSQKAAVRVEVDPQKLAAHGIGIDEVATAISERQREPADRHDVRRHEELRRAGQRPAAARPPRTARSSSRTATAIPSA